MNRRIPRPRATDDVYLTILLGRMADMFRAQGYSEDVIQAWIERRRSIPWPPTSA